MEEKKRLSFWKLLLIALLSATILLGSFVGLYLWKTGAFNLLFSSSDPEEMGLPSWIDPQLIVVDDASRRGEKLEAVRDIAVHYVGNPGTSAQANRNYFNNPDSEVSSHMVQRNPQLPEYSQRKNS